MRVFENYKKYLDKNSIVVGFTGLLNHPIDKINKTFVAKSFDWQKIKQNCPKFYVFHSDNDPYVPLEKAEELAKNLGVDVILVKNAGHFNEKAGYIKFELLLEKIKNELEEGKKEVDELTE